MSYQKYIDKALQMGATDAVPFTIDDIAFDTRTLLKCMYGCTDWGCNHTCPSRPGNPSIPEMQEMFKRYKGGIIIHTHEKKLSQKISFRIEGDAFGDGYYFAMSLSDCGLCETCSAVDGKPCRFKRQARPAFHSVGIDVFKTVRGLGLPISTLRDVRGLGLPISTLRDPDNEEQNWYSAVFIE